MGPQDNIPRVPNLTNPINNCRMLNEVIFARITSSRCPLVTSNNGQQRSSQERFFHRHKLLGWAAASNLQTTRLKKFNWLLMNCLATKVRTQQGYTSGNSYFFVINCPWDASDRQIWNSKSKSFDSHRLSDVSEKVNTVLNRWQKSSLHPKE